MPVAKWAAGPQRRRASVHIAFRFALGVVALLVLSFVLGALRGGDAVLAALGPTADPRLVTLERHQLGLDRSLVAQLGHYLDSVAHGRLGTSLITGEPVSALVSSGAGTTFLLAGLATVLAVAAGTTVGLIAGSITATGRFPALTTVLAFATAAVAAVPAYLLAVALVAVFAVGWNLVQLGPQAGPAGYVLPVVALAAAPAAALARLVRAETVRVRDSTQARAAAARRLGPVRYAVSCVLPTVAAGVLATAGLVASALLVGTVLVEYVFALPGLGARLVTALGASDFPVVRAIVLVLGGTTLVVNLVVDVALVVLDPRRPSR